MAMADLYIVTISLGGEFCDQWLRRLFDSLSQRLDVLRAWENSPCFRDDFVDDDARRGDLLGLRGSRVSCDCEDVPILQLLGDGRKLLAGRRVFRVQIGGDDDDVIPSKLF
jgi:hypothetical protein